MSELQDIARRVKLADPKDPVTPAEFAYLIRNDKHALMAFLIANNPASMNDILRHKLGYTHELGFTPDVNAIKGVAQKILDLADENDPTSVRELSTITNNFKVNLAALSPELKQALQTAFKNN